MKYRLQLKYKGEWVTIQEFDSREEATQNKNESASITGGAYRIQEKGVDGQWATC